MMKSSVVAAMLISLAIGTGLAFAEDAPPPANAPPSANAPAAKMSPADKKAISKSCSDQATAKGLHGKARKEFRSACRKRGGKPE